MARVCALIKEYGIPLEPWPASSMEQQFSSFNHQGIIAWTAPLPTYTETHLETLWQCAPKPRLALMLDGIQDPHNLGACLRTADLAGVAMVIIPKDQSVSLTPAAIKVASGAASFVPLVTVTNLVVTLKRFQKFGAWIYGAAGEATKTLYDESYPENVVLVMGSEGKGLRRLTREHCDVLIKIPTRGHIESLNVSVATGICLFEIIRQHQTSCSQ